MLHQLGLDHFLSPELFPFLHVGMLPRGLSPESKVESKTESRAESVTAEEE